MRGLRDHALSTIFGVLFLIALAGQALTGFAVYNEQQVSDGLTEVTLLSYVTSSNFAVDVAENWQSEYLQFALYILLTVWFVQRGSTESKEPGNEGPGSDEDAQVGEFARPDSPAWARTGGLRRTLYSNSLVAVMLAVFVLSWLAQSIAGQVSFNEEQLASLEAPVTWAEYAVSPDFWSRTLQNWQSEFLAVGSMAVFSVYLRQRGSPESKPVGAPHEETGTES
ncbi:DUF6766 family protein [Planctomonas deserti]|uniref:DUF6766 family protein n=1 Tax=Planctomonas deserti TaxID=2144185 RepID=UPI000D39F3EE|nr:DUF6766 family protein [Planctomonas deserti]